MTLIIQNGIRFQNTGAPGEHEEAEEVVMVVGWVYKTKVHADGSIERRKLDIQNAFLHGTLTDQALRAWFAQLNSWLLDYGFRASQFDASLFVLAHGDLRLYLLVYINDFIITRSQASAIDTFTHDLALAFPVKDFCPLSYFLDLEATINHGMFFSPKSSLTLQAYSDADWAGCPDDRKSTAGYCVFMGHNLVSWSSKKQKTVARSSTKAEYKSVASSAVELIWL
ncbi:hypothetical protein F2P56_017701 [Juglans regia]|uniref:Reverse transcriptase Ty1/copia-type domain-containing protein n=1 Tax=Juglans regia TaxID=51240 RepID=A0A833UT64_JUGRE|nr:hypothetical protein F2P56_017701 [Juglans regia]